MKLLAKDGKLLMRGGKLIAVDNPDDCDCCGDWWCVQYSPDVAVCEQHPTRPPNAISNAYPDQQTCQANCQPNALLWYCVANDVGGVTTYQCIQSWTVPPNAVGGAYQTQQQCQQACGPPWPPQVCPAATDTYCDDWADDCSGLGTYATCNGLSEPTDPGFPFRYDGGIWSPGWYPADPAFFAGVPVVMRNKLSVISGGTSLMPLVVPRVSFWAGGTVRMRFGDGNNFFLFSFSAQRFASTPTGLQFTIFGESTTTTSTGPDLQAGDRFELQLLLAPNGNANFDVTPKGVIYRGADVIFTLDGTMVTRPLPLCYGLFYFSGLMWTSGAVRDAGGCDNLYVITTP